MIVATELMDVANGSQVWGEQYNRQMKDVLVLQDEITREISEKLRTHAHTGGGRSDFPPSHGKRRGLSALSQGALLLRYPEHSRREAEHGYSPASHQDRSHYALAYAGLANSYIPSDTALPPRSLVPLAKAAAAKALETDPRLAEAHIAQGRVLQHGDWDWPAAEREFKRAIELNPKNPEAHHMYSHYLMPLGRSQEAVSEAKRALELDATDVLINMHLGWAYLFARQYDAAVTQLRKARDMDPSLATTYEMLGRAYRRVQCMKRPLTRSGKGSRLAGSTGENPAAGLQSGLRALR